LKKRLFYDEITTLSKILQPIKTAILMVEREQTNLANTFIQIIRLEYILKKSININTDMIQFRQHAIQVFNKKWEEFDILIYLLAYFLHPVYCDNVFFIIFILFYLNKF